MARVLITGIPVKDSRQQLTPISYVIFRREDFVLLQLRQGTGYLDGYWATAAAGHVEANESAHEAAAREVQEELGVTINTNELLPLVVMHRKQGQNETYIGRVDFFFQVTAWPSEPHLMEQDKASDLRWFHLDDLPTPVVPHELHVLESLRSGMPGIISFGFPAGDSETRSPHVRAPASQTPAVGGPLFGHGYQASQRSELTTSERSAR